MICLNETKKIYLSAFHEMNTTFYLYQEKFVQIKKY